MALRGNTRLLGAAVGIGLVAACSVAGYVAFADPSQCEQERDMIRDITSHAEPTMEGVTVAWIPHQGCGESTEPVAGVSADIVDWRQRRLGLDHLADRGWQRQPDTFHFTSPNGDYEAAVIMAGVADEHPDGPVPMHVEIYFKLADTN